MAHLTTLARLRVLAPALALLAVLLLAACGSGGDEAARDDPNRPLVVYSGRAEKLVGPLFERFERQTGQQVDVRYGDSAELAATLAEEGGNSPADVFFAQDAGSLGAVAEQDLLRPLPPAVLDRVDRRFRDPDGRWVGTSGRARVVAYDTRRQNPRTLPDTIFAFAEPRWRGKIAFAPTNASFQAFVSAMRLAAGDERTRAWLRGVDRNEPKLLENNLQTLEALARGEAEVGFVNHYYLSEVKAERPETPVANHFLRAGDPGSLVNAAGVGELREGDRPDAARRLTEYLLGREGQGFFARDTDEYPLAGEARPGGNLRPLSEIQGPDVELGQLGAKLPSTAQMISEAGLGS
jgi:iron(III) transport system substrate-binding protein